MPCINHRKLRSNNQRGLSSSSSSTRVRQCLTGTLLTCYGGALNGLENVEMAPDSVLVQPIASAGQFSLSLLLESVVVVLCNWLLHAPVTIWTCVAACMVQLLF